MPKNTLRVADRMEMLKIKERIKKYLPNCSTVYGAIEAGLQYPGLSDLTGTKTYFADDSSLVVTTPMVAGSSQSVSFFWDANEDDDDAEIARLLGQLPDLDWDEDVMLYASPPHLIEKVKMMIINGCLGNGRLSPQPMTGGYIYGMETSSIRLQVPKGFKLRKVRAQDTRQMLDCWKYGSQQTHEQYQRLLQILPGYVIERETVERNECRPTNERKQRYARESSEEGEDDYRTMDDRPISWTHIAATNTIRNTFTLPEYRRLGLATVVTLSLADHCIKTIGRATLYVEENNVDSILFHEKMGFSRQCRVAWQRFKQNKKHTFETVTETHDGN